MGFVKKYIDSRGGIDFLSESEKEALVEMATRQSTIVFGKSEVSEDPRNRKRTATIKVSQGDKRGYVYGVGTPGFRGWTYRYSSTQSFINAFGGEQWETYDNLSELKNDIREFIKTGKRSKWWKKPKKR